MEAIYTLKIMIFTPQKVFAITTDIILMFVAYPNYKHYNRFY